MNEKRSIRGEMTMKTIVIFKSKTGFVKQYAEWIAEELSGDLYEASKVTAERLTSYDTINYSEP